MLFRSDSLGDEVRITVIAAGFDSGVPSHKKLDPTPVTARTVAKGQAGQVGQTSRPPPSSASPAAGSTATGSIPVAAPVRHTPPNPASWQPATGGRRPSRPIPVTDDFDDDDEVDVPPFMKR